LTDEEEDDDKYDCELDELSPKKMRVIQDAEDGVTASLGGDFVPTARR